jgi:hypothetical protein
LDDQGNKFEIVTYRYPNDAEITIISPNINSLPLPAHSDFIGWKLEGTNIIYSAEEIETLDFSGVDEYVFIMCVETHKYNITFVNGDGTRQIKQIEYNQKITAPNNLYPYLPDTDLDLTRAY